MTKFKNNRFIVIIEHLQSLKEPALTLKVSIVNGTAQQGDTSCTMQEKFLDSNTTGPELKFSQFQREYTYFNINATRTFVRILLSYIGLSGWTADFYERKSSHILTRKVLNSMDRRR